jgi:RHS repeat-associated protein
MAWTTSYYHFDAVGSTRGVTGADQNFQAFYPQTAFGEQLVDVNAVMNHFRFIGQFGYHFDASTEMYNVRQRFYSAALARWISKDPARSDENVFRYARNNPLLHVDASGMYILAPKDHDISRIVNRVTIYYLNKFKRTDQDGWTRWEFTQHMGLLDIATERRWDNIEEEIIFGLLASDREFRFAGKTAEQTKNKLLWHVAERKIIASLAAKPGPIFGYGNNKANADYWYLDRRGRLKVREGSAFSAVFDVIAHGSNYRTGCTEACDLAMLASLAAAHKNDPGWISWFNTWAGSDPVGRSQDFDFSNPANPKGFYGASGPLDRQLNVSWHDWIPGDWGWIKNIDERSSSNTDGLEGKNIIYIGNGKFSGAYSTSDGPITASLEDYLKYVYRWREKEPTAVNVIEMKTSYRRSPKGALSDARDFPRIW